MCTANLIVTNHEAQHFPGCRLNRNCSSSSEGGMGFQQSISQLIFDRVLCDVPCSGDGTLRKAPDIWRKWYCFSFPSLSSFNSISILPFFQDSKIIFFLYRNSGMGNGIHCLQVQIAMRGTFDGKSLMETVCDCIPLLVRIVRFFWIIQFFCLSD